MAEIWLPVRDRHTSLIVRHLAVPKDDHVVHALVRIGPVVSAPRHPAFVEAYDGSGPPEATLAFRMSLLEASTIVETYPEASTTGLLGVWCLHGATEQLTFKSRPLGLLSNSLASSGPSADDVWAFLCDPVSLLAGRYMDTRRQISNGGLS
jgi:hypothetical protein